MKTPLKVYTTNGTTLTLAEHVENYASARFSRKRSGFGTFSIRINGKLEKAQSFQVGRFVWFSPILSRVGIITKINKTKEGDSEVWTVQGIESKGLTKRRQIWYSGLTYYTINGSAENVIKTAITRFMGSTEASRNVPLINVGTLGGAGNAYLLSERMSELGNALEECSNSTGVWWRFEINTTTGKLDVVVTAPVNRTTGQTVNPPAPFSDKFKTIGSSDYSEDITDYRNVAIVAGQGELASRTVRTIGSITGIDRIEEFYDARDLSTNADLDQRGADKLASVAETIGIDVVALTKSQLVPDVDYNIGDIVTVSSFGVSVDKAITDITESWDESGYNVDLTFGKSVPEDYDYTKEVKKYTQKAVSV